MRKEAYQQFFNGSYHETKPAKWKWLKRKHYRTKLGLLKGYLNQKRIAEKTPNNTWAKVELSLWEELLYTEDEMLTRSRFLLIFSVAVILLIGAIYAS